MIVQFTLQMVMHGTIQHGYNAIEMCCTNCPALFMVVLIPLVETWSVLVILVATGLYWLHTVVFLCI